MELSRSPNIKIQRAGSTDAYFHFEILPAADLGVSRIPGKGAGLSR